MLICDEDCGIFIQPARLMVRVLVAEAVGRSGILPINITGYTKFHCLYGSIYNHCNHIKEDVIISRKQAQSHSTYVN